MTLNCGQKIDYRSSYIMKLFMKLLKKKKKKKKKKNTIYGKLLHPPQHSFSYLTISH